MTLQPFVAHSFDASLHQFQMKPGKVWDFCCCVGFQLLNCGHQKRTPATGPSPLWTKELPTEGHWDGQLRNTRHSHTPHRRRAHDTCRVWNWCCGRHMQASHLISLSRCARKVPARLNFCDPIHDCGPLGERM